MSKLFNISYRKVGGILFVKIGRVYLSFCLTKEFRAIKKAGNLVQSEFL